MNRTRATLHALVWCVLAAGPLAAQERFELALGEGVGAPGERVTIPVSMTSTADVQGIVVAFEWNGEVAEGVELTPTAALDAADLVVARVEADYMVLGVVVDTDGDGPDAIPAVDDQTIAEASLTCLPIGEGEVSTGLALVDGKYASIEGGPILDNLLAIGGLSIRMVDGLELTDGLLTCRAPESTVEFAIVPSGAAPGACVDVPIVMASNTSIEGYELSVVHPDGLDLQSIELGAAAIANGADFHQAEVFEFGGTLGVVLDLSAPFAGNVIPPGSDLEIALYRYCCPPIADPDVVEILFPLEFADDVLGDPPKANTAVSGGVEVPVTLVNGSVLCSRELGDEICDNGVDDDGDGLVDENDPDCRQASQMFACGAREKDADGNPAMPTGQVGQTVEVCFFYKSPEDNVAGGAQFDQVQGLSMGVCYPCELSCDESSLDIAGTIVEAVEADFVSLQCDNDANDGDGCELILGILVDSLPPFDGRTLPPTDDFMRVGCVDFTIASDSQLCGQCLPISFCDGVNGRGKVPIKNLISAENESLSPMVMDCEVCVTGDGTFHRGDCNFSDMGNMSVDIADPAAVISFLFMSGPWQFQPPCLDACDCNDDGRIDLADATCMLHFLFLFGSFPPDPGPGFDMMGMELPRGPDPTPDLLGCQGGAECQ